MFDREYEFKGKHAIYVLSLTSNPFSEDGKGRGVFQRNIDVYMLAPLIGLIYNRKAAVDNSVIKSTKIFTDAFSRRSDELRFLLTTILLNDREVDSADIRIENAFKGVYDDTRVAELSDKFDKYLLGGIEILYENIMQDSKDFDEVLSNLYTFIEDFNKRYSTSLIKEQSIFDDIQIKV